MKIVMINGSPRKKGHTSKLLAQAKLGAESANAEVKVYNLYDYDYKGCISCMTCKREGFHGRCVKKDDYTAILEDMTNADAIIVGSPIYMGDVSGAVRCLLERFTFCNHPYGGGDVVTYFNRRISVGFIYTIGSKEERAYRLGFIQNTKMIQTLLSTEIGDVETMYMYGTFLAEDRSKYDCSFDPSVREKYISEQMPKYKKEAFDFGKNIALKTVK